MTEPIRVLIVDDHRLFSQALELLLRDEDGIQVLGAEETGEGAVGFCRETPVDVALVDIDLPGMDGIAVTQRLREVKPETRIVVITAFQQQDVMARALTAGASGYVLKTDVADTLVGAIKMAMSGSMVLPAGRFLPAAAPAAPPARAPLEPRERPAERQADDEPQPARAAPGARRGGPLSDREVEILQAIADGTTTTEMAETFAISENTVRTYVKRILSKLDAHSKAEAVMKGVRLGLISTGPSG